LDYEVVVEKGAGESASFRDEDYVAVCAFVVGADEAWGSEVVLRLIRPYTVDADALLSRRQQKEP
jgi:H+-translocating NAD(P) transhydrogenase subunit alpha